jgi:hypothetical protein
MGWWWRAFNGSAWIAAAGGSLVVRGERGELSGVVLHREIVTGSSGMDDSEEEATTAWARGVGVGVRVTRKIRVG